MESLKELLLLSFSYCGQLSLFATVGTLLVIRAKEQIKRKIDSSGVVLDVSIVWGVSAQFLNRFTLTNKVHTFSSPLFPPGVHPDPPHWWNDGEMVKNTGNVTSAIIVPATKHHQITYIERHDVANHVDQPCRSTC